MPVDKLPKDLEKLEMLYEQAPSHRHRATLACMKLWKSVVVLAVVGTVFGCSKAPAVDEPSVDQIALERGRQVYLAEDCGACHGPQFEGTEFAPALLNVADLWSADNLAAFLIEPMVDADYNPRLAEVADQYELEMPGVQDASEEQVSDLVVFLMNGP